MLVRLNRCPVVGAVLFVAACGSVAHVRRDPPSPPPSAAAASGPDSLVLRGRALLAATRDSLPQYARASMRCFSCHLDEGERAGAMPLRGAYARLPAYQPRAGRVITIEDRVNNCFTRSLAGTPLPAGSRDMQAIVAYLRTLSPSPTVPAPSHEATDVVFSGSAERGSREFEHRCARCHGATGAGTTIAPPLWGPHSFGIGASFARIGRIVPFIRRNMPYDSAGTLDSATAVDIAAYIVSRPRPDTPGKSGDWPRGDAPWDVPYATKGHRPLHEPVTITTLATFVHALPQSSITHATEK